MKKIIKIILLVIFLPLSILFAIIDFIFNEENIDKMVEKLFKWLDK